MFKRFDYKVVNENYIVYVIENNGMYEYWLQNEDYGVMYLLFSVEEFDLGLVEHNLLDNIKMYKKLFETE